MNWKCSILIVFQFFIELISLGSVTACWQEEDTGAGIFQGIGFALESEIECGLLICSIFVWNIGWGQGTVDVFHCTWCICRCIDSLVCHKRLWNCNWSTYCGGIWWVLNMDGAGLKIAWTSTIAQNQFSPKGLMGQHCAGVNCFSYLFLSKVPFRTHWSPKSFNFHLYICFLTTNDRCILYFINLL